MRSNALSRTFWAALSLCLLFAQAAEAGPKRAAKAVGRQFKQTFYTDVKQHPFAWGLNLGLQFGIAFSDTASSCMASGIEAGPAHYFVGHHPNCRKLVLLTSTAMTIHALSENWLAHAFKDSCEREARNPDSRWWRTPSHTKSTAACFWAVPTADTTALAAYEIPVIKGNITLAEHGKD